MIRILLMVATFFAASTHLAAETPGSAALPVKAAVEMRHFLRGERLSVSPDDEWIAYTLRNESRRRAVSEPRFQWHSPSGVTTFAGEGCEVWISRADGSESRRIDGGKGSSWNPVWAPNGRQLAFYSDRDGSAGLWVWEKKSGRVRRLSRSLVRPLLTSEAPAWSPDSSRLLCKVLPPDVTLTQAAEKFTAEALRERVGTEATEPSIRVYRTGMPVTAPANEQLDSYDLTYRSRADLALVPLSGGSIEWVAREVFPYTYGFSPDGHYIFYTSNGQVRLLPANDVHDLHLYSLRTRDSERVASLNRTWWGRPIAWSPSGAQVCAVSYQEEVTVIRFFTPGSDGKARECRVPVSSADPGQMPAWNRAGNRVYLVAGNGVWEAEPNASAARRVGALPEAQGAELVASDSRFVLWEGEGPDQLFVRAVDPETRDALLYRMEIRTGACTLVQRAPESWEGAMEPANSGKGLFHVSAAADRPPDVWLLPASHEAPRQVTRANAEWGRFKLGRSRLLEWSGPEGQRLRGALLLPPDYRAGRRYPLVVRVYGNARLSNRLNDYGLWGTGPEDCQLLATRGFAVLLPDAPLRTGRLAEDLAATVLSGVDRAVELGFADPERVGVVGQSYGGYSALSLATRGARIKAAVVAAGMADLMSLYGHMREDGSAITGYWERVLGANPWENRDRYIDNSPLYALDRVRCPVLLLHGEVDVSTPLSDVSKAFVGLRRLERKAELVVYLGEGHVPGRWNATHQQDYAQRMIRWFEDHLR